MSKGEIQVVKVYEAVRVRTGQERVFSLFEDARLWVMVGLAGHVTCVETDQDDNHEQRKCIVFRT